MQNLNYAGIGARQIGPADKNLITTVAQYLVTKHYCVHSGAAEGTDQQFSTAALASVDQHHPAPDRLSWGARLVHARNYRILVPRDPVAFVVAAPSVHNGKPVGGTMQGIRIAKKLGIPVVLLNNKSIDSCLEELARLSSSIW